MNFELKTLTLAAAAKTNTDTLIVLISEHFQAGKDPVSELIQKAIRAKDFSAKAGKSLQAYAVAGVAAAKIILVGVGEGKPSDVKSGVMGAMAILKATESSKVLLAFAGATNAAQLHAAVLAVAEGTYVYGTPIPSPKPANSCK
jgi:leucyl aminopeptidase